jgi:hypothetical protein
MRLALPALAAVAVAVLLPASALAATATVSGTLTGGQLTVSTTAAPKFADNLDNGDQTQNYMVRLSVQDTRGTGAGWQLTITSTQFTTGGAAPRLLASSASSMTRVRATKRGGTSTLPTNSVTYPLTVPAGTTPPAPLTFFNAAVQTGMGQFNVTPTIGVFVPQNSYAGTYQSTLTLAIISGP